VLPCDVEDLASVDAVFAALDEAWPEGRMRLAARCATSVNEKQEITIVREKFSRVVAST
jgi:hypothetical protein